MSERYMRIAVRATIEYADQDLKAPANRTKPGALESVIVGAYEQGKIGS